MFESFKRGMSNTRQAFTERMNVILDRGPKVDDDFWDGLEEALILSDVGAQAACDIVETMRSEATRHALPDAYAVMDTLAENISQKFTSADQNLFDENPVCVLFVGINGAGKTTTVGKIASEAKARGRNVLLGSADTFRAAAIEQLEEWARRANVEIVERERGSDPASVCYDTIERAEAAGSDLVLIDTAGRLHTSDDLMRELQKVVNVVRKRAQMPVKTVLVIDATTGQNGLAQAQQFDRALDLDAIIVTKLDGTAKGGIALAVSHDLGLPIAKIGVGEALEDLQDFDALDFAAALIGAEPAAREEEPESKELQVKAGAEDEASAEEVAKKPEIEAEPEPEDELALAAEEEPVPEFESELAAEPAAEAEPEPAVEADLKAEPEEEPAETMAAEDEGVPNPAQEPMAAAADVEPDAAPEDETEQEGASEEEPETEAAAEEPEEEKKGRLRRIFKWRGRNK